jgi:hypothetical protein
MPSCLHNSLTSFLPISAMVEMRPCVKPLPASGEPFDGDGGCHVGHFDLASEAREPPLEGGKKTFRQALLLRFVADRAEKTVCEALEKLLEIHGHPLCHDRRTDGHFQHGGKAARGHAEHVHAGKALKPIHELLYDCRVRRGKLQEMALESPRIQVHRERLSVRVLYPYKLLEIDDLPAPANPQFLLDPVDL